MDSCDTRVQAYKNGKTFADCRKVAQSLTTDLKKQIDEKGNMQWDDILKQADFDAVVFKLILKYLRQNGYNIGDGKNPQVKIS